MSLPRFFLPSGWSGGRVPLDAGDLHHLVTVLRAAPGRRIAVVTPDGCESVVRIDRCDDAGVWASPEERSGPAWTPSVTLFQGIAKNPAMDLVVQKATEIGVARIVPFFAERSVVRLDAARSVDRRERWERIAGEAAKQSGRAGVPRMETPATLAEALDPLAAFERSLLFCEEGEAPGVAEALAGADRGSSVAVVVGPEGGLSAGEVASLEAVGARRAALGPTVLRTETAGIVAVTLAMFVLGGLGAREDA